MSGPAVWEESRSGTTGELILTVDIPSGDTPSGFDELVPLLDTPHTVWRAVERAEAPLEGGSLATYVEPWADAVRAGGHRVRAVLGHRVGSILAGAIAEALSGPGQPPPSVLLFDPELVDTDTVLSAFRRLLADAPHPLTAEEVDRLALDSDSAAEQCPDDPAALAVRLRSDFIRATSRSGERARARTGSVDRLSVLALAETYDVLPVWARCTALSSSRPDRGLSRSRAALLLPEADLVAREVSFGEWHAEVLSSPVVARTVSELLTASRPR
ncbi:hypothetical protein ACH4CE_29105 [Streptomyces gelaticus]|uniref:hypothetical protein n=1 Tax=Streptomyces gelaticus TaxID=285446 RepID=UPI0037B78719